MALIVADRVKQKTTTTGNGTISFSSTVDGFQTFANVCSTNDTFYYTIQEQSGTDFEVGHGTFNASGQLERTNVLQSSNSDSAVVLGAGTKEVFITYPADKAVIQNYNGTITIPSTIDGRDLAIDGAKLDGIASGAEVNVNADWNSSSGDSQISNKPTIPSGNAIIDWTADQGGTNIHAGNYTDTDTTYSVGDGGLTQNNFTTTLKNKLDAIASGAEVNVQSDWNAGSGDAQILNKPTIPTNNNQLSNGAGYITTDTNTTYSAGTGMSLAGTTFNCNIDAPNEVGLGNLSNNGNTVTANFTVASGAIIAQSGIDIDYGGAGVMYYSTSGNGTIVFQKQTNFAVNVWIYGGDGYGRIYFGSGGHTYWSSPSNHYFRHYAGGSTTDHTLMDTSGNFTCIGNVTGYGSVSDEKKKYDIEKIEKPFDFLDKVKGVKFKYVRDHGKGIGLIAQDVQKTEFSDELVYNYEDLETKEENLALRYENIVAILVESTKQQQEQIKELREEVEGLKKNKCKCKCKEA